MSVRRVLLVSHEAGRTGAPLSALTLAREFTRLGIELMVIVRRDGPLRPQFEAIAPTFVFRREPSFGLMDMALMSLRTDPILAVKCLRNPGRPYCLNRDDAVAVDALSKTVAAWAPDAVYVNTTHCGDVLDVLGPLDAPVLMHVRELGVTLKALDTRRRHAIVRHTDHAVCVSDRVARELVAEFPSLEKKTSIEPPAVEFGVRTQASDRLALGDIVSDAIVVLGVGTVGRRKGTDLFVEAAKRVLRQWSTQRAIRFVWVGDGPEREGYLRQLAAEGLADQIRFPGEKNDLLAYYERAHALLCTSREDPYPRIMIEAGICGVPVIAFEGAGGSDDYILNYDAGERVGFGDAEAMADALIGVLNKEPDPACARALAERVQQGHAPAASAQRIVDVLADMIDSPERANG